MKKKLVYLILFAILIETSYTIRKVNGYECEMITLKTDKNSYYTDEEIRINASWNLDYDPFSEYAYIQLNIYDFLDNHIWNSSWYDEIGFFKEQWSINTTQLKTTFLNYSNKIYIKLYFYYWDGELHPFLRAIEEITIFKRIPLCELIGFRDHINYGENLTFLAKFYDNELENDSLMKYQLISLIVKSNNSFIFSQNFTTDQFGSFEISLSSLEHLHIGLNKLILNIVQNNIYNSSVFQYEILVEKTPVFINIIKNQIIKKKIFVIQLYYFYFFNNSTRPLNNQSIKFEIQNHQKLIFSQIYHTNNEGFLSLNISLTILNITIETDEITIIFKYSGNYFLQNKTISLFLKIYDLKEKKSLNTTIILIILASIISLVIPLLLIYRFKKERRKMLTEIVIKY